jgi:UDP-N-acetylglucosamine 4,6-dehydratase/5-epimerase
VFEGTIILITGGTGSWGKELVTQLLLKNPKEIKIFSRGEFAQVTMQREFLDSRLKFIIGDVRDLEGITTACRNVDYIFHLAALKHVPICEVQPMEAIKTNTIGTKNLIDAALANNVKKVIDVSTDKAVSPINVYGMSKAIGEKLIINANNSGYSTKFICIRGGNVMGTNGSVIPFWIDQINKFDKVTVTDPTMTRYFITLQEAIGLLFKASEKSVGGETFVLKMPACKITALAEVLIEHYGKESTKIEEIGIRLGEKIHEILISRSEAPNTYEYEENYYLILPPQEVKDINQYYEKFNLKKVTFETYSSNTFLMNKSEIHTLLTKGGFLN